MNKKVVSYTAIMKRFIMPLFLVLAGISLIVKANAWEVADMLQPGSGNEETTMADGTMQQESSSREDESDVPAFYASDSTIRVLLKNGNSIYHSSEHPDNYPGKMDIYETESGYVYVNEVSLEDYVAGVLYAEMPQDFSDEALKAQAVCARSFALSHTDGFAYPDYKANVDDSVSFQAYGTNGMDERAKKIVETTKSTVLTYQGKIVTAYFFSTSWGVTADGSVWNGKKDILQSVLLKKTDGNENFKADVSGFNLQEEDNFARFYQDTESCLERDVPWFRWKTELSFGSIRTALSEYLERDISGICSFHIIKRSEYGLVQSMEIITEDEKIVLEGQNEIRTVLAPDSLTVILQDGTEKKGLSMLPSAYFYLNEGEDGITIFGGGFGHGAGMSQYGAEILAKGGKSWEEILHIFFPKADITEFHKS